MYNFIRVDVSITDHLRYFELYLEKYKAMQFFPFFLCRKRSN